MKYEKSHIGKIGIRWIPVEGYIRKDGKKIPAYLKKTAFKWKSSN